MTKYAMVIDLNRCTGCGGCIIACTNENNLDEGVFWSSKISETVGTFPNVRFTYIPTLCNHCDNAPCVTGCPTSAMYKDEENGLTLHDPGKCIGCRYCMVRCPYGVINFIWEEQHKIWKSQVEIIPQGTESPMEIVRQVGGKGTPYYNPEREATLPGIRPRGVVEKCTFCDHRVREGELPYCVEACPANARIVGDLDDPNSAVRRILGKYKPFRLREELGTEPKVYYVRSYSPSDSESTKGDL